MTKLEEARKEVVAAKEWLERALVRLDSSIKEKEGTVTLRIQYEAEREDTITIPQTSLFQVEEGALCVKEPGEDFVLVVSTSWNGPLANKAFCLNNEFDWKLGKDEEDVLCLVPIKKDD